MFTEAGLAPGGVPPFGIADDEVGVGVYLGTQYVDVAASNVAFARDYTVALDAYIDDSGAPVVQVSIDITRDCETAPDAIEVGPYALAAVVLPEGAADRPVRFVDVIREGAAASCGVPLPDPAALLVRSSRDTSVTLGVVPEPRAPETHGYEIDGLSVPPDDTLLVRVPQLPGPGREHWAQAIDGSGSSLRITVSTDAPSDLFFDLTTFEQYVAWQRELAGPGARDCEQIIVEGADGESFRCLVDALAGDEPFVAALGNGGIDSVDWTGAVRDSAGRLFATRYGSGLSTTGTLWGNECEALRLGSLEVTCATADADLPEIIRVDGS